MVLYQQESSADHHINLLLCPFSDIAIHTTHLFIKLHSEYFMICVAGRLPLQFTPINEYILRKVQLRLHICYLPTDVRLRHICYLPTDVRLRHICYLPTDVRLRHICYLPTDVRLRHICYLPTDVRLRRNIWSVTINY